MCLSLNLIKYTICQSLLISCQTIPEPSFDMATPSSPSLLSLRDISVSTRLSQSVSIHKPESLREERCDWLGTARQHVLSLGDWLDGWMAFRYLHTYTSLLNACLCVLLCVFVCVFMCMCVLKWSSSSLQVCVCVCVCVHLYHT